MTGRIVWLACACPTLAACSDDVLTFRPVIDIPVDEDANPLSLISQVELAVVNGPNAITRRFSRGEQLVLPFEFGEDLVVHMTGFFDADDSVVAYGRTCAFDLRSDADADTAPHLYFSRTRPFADQMQTLARRRGTAVGLGGSGVMIGGVDGSGPVAMGELFNPRTGAVEPIGPFAERTGGVVVAQDAFSRVAVIGGEGAGAGSIEMYRAGIAGIQTIAAPELERVGATALALPSGDIVVIGGKLVEPPPATTAFDARAYVFRGSKQIVEPSGSIMVGRAWHTATRLGSDLGAPILIVGGMDDAGNALDSVELFQPFTGDSSARPSLTTPRWGHQAVQLRDGSVLIIGGRNTSGLVATVERYMPDGTMTVLSADEVGDSWPVFGGVVGFSATRLADDRILLAGGLDATGTVVTTAWLVNVNASSGNVDFVGAEGLAVARADHQAVLLCDGTVLISGGTDEPSLAERYNPDRGVAPAQTLLRDVDDVAVGERRNRDLDDRFLAREAGGDL
ncbi:MAG: Kelch repeat-containing protein [Kofleriaceae bacterium]